MKKVKLIVILGPTASGKTEFGLKLAKKFKGEIISADSRTIYKGMDIATAKPLQDKKLKIKNKKHKLKTKKNEILKPLIASGIPHYMIDVVQPNKEFTVAEFKQKAIKIIKDIHRRKKVPFLVGGTGLYISALVDNLEIPRVAPDKKLRKKIEKMIARHGLNYLWQKLIKLDPEAKKFVQKENPRRIIRAMEVCLKSKKPFSELRKKGQPLFDTLQIGVKFSRGTLYERINQRVDKMIKAGLVKEVKRLTKKYSPDLPSMSGIGYQEIIFYLQGKITLLEAIDLIKKNTRHYARRQISWFRRDKRIRWIKKEKEAEKLIKEFFSLKAP